MTQQEHLNRIRARCVELLEIAKHRTPGRWYVAKGGLGNKDGMDTVYATNDDLNYIAACRDFACFHAPPKNSENATFIASCAGAAEAGWRATIAAIDSLPGYASLTEAANPSVRLIGGCAQDGINSIIASWPEELL